MEENNINKVGAKIYFEKLNDLENRFDKFLNNLKAPLIEDTMSIEDLVEFNKKMVDIQLKVLKYCIGYRVNSMSSIGFFTAILNRINNSNKKNLTLDERTLMMENIVKQMGDI